MSNHNAVVSADGARPVWSPTGGNTTAATTLNHWLSPPCPQEFSASSQRLGDATRQSTDFRDATNGGAQPTLVEGFVALDAHSKNELHGPTMDANERRRTLRTITTGGEGGI